MIKIVQVVPKQNLKLWLKFEDGLEGTVDLTELKGKGVFKIWENPGVFEKVFVHPESGALAWNDEVEICADALYLKISGKSSKDLFKLIRDLRKSA
ncbi:MAG TPA: DUF2442 domain-containing protein [Caldithrix abyssi]|uniref:DUF2442 domain-containing protein n=1 Tax=Caldithrix abyssi TaxID=187145 RepID=A0A7V5H409_CALAY|nr:DUF2442 domain-containing protein [Caldithrix abyssi]